MLPSPFVRQEFQKITKEVYGDDIVWTPWLRPGFELGLALQEVSAKNPQAKGVMLGQHGLINWAMTRRIATISRLISSRKLPHIEKAYKKKGGDKKAFGGQKHATLPEKVRRKVFAKLLPWLRGQVSQQNASSAPSRTTPPSCVL